MSTTAERAAARTARETAAKIAQYGSVAQYDKAQANWKAAKPDRIAAAEEANKLVTAQRAATRAKAEQEKGTDAKKVLTDYINNRVPVWSVTKVFDEVVNSVTALVPKIGKPLAAVVPRQGYPVKGSETLVDSTNLYIGYFQKFLSTSSSKYAFKVADGWEIAKEQREPMGSHNGCSNCAMVRVELIRKGAVSIVVPLVQPANQAVAVPSAATPLSRPIIAPVIRGEGVENQGQQPESKTILWLGAIGGAFVIAAYAVYHKIKR